MSTKISWTNETWNPVTGCSHVSAGCVHCYAERLSLRFKHTTKPWTAQNAAENVVLHPERLDAPRHWKTPRRVFVNSMSDLFHENVPFEFVKQVFEVMNDKCARKHTFQILTKRPERMQTFISSAAVNGLRLAEYPLSNVWLGVSVEDQKTADARIPLLLQTPAAVRFLSCEPLLGEIELKWFRNKLYRQQFGVLNGMPTVPDIDWVIVGGESGHGFRPMQEDWARSIRDQCVAANVPLWFKQHSALRSETNPLLDGVEWHQMPEAIQ